MWADNFIFFFFIYPLRVFVCSTIILDKLIQVTNVLDTITLHSRRDVSPTPSKHEAGVLKHRTAAFGPSVCFTAFILCNCLRMSKPDWAGLQLVSCHFSVNSEILYRNISLTIPSPHSFRSVCFKLILLDSRLTLEVASGYAYTLCSSVFRLSATWNISSS
jgi:hypothetical protein